MNEFFKIEDLEKCMMSKEEMWKELDGKTVRCMTTDIMFGVQDIETRKVYILDCKEK